MRCQVACLFFIAAALTGLGGCSTIPSPEQRLQNVDRLVAGHDWRRLDIETPPFVLAAWQPRQSLQKSSSASSTLTVYIEGDGLAWVTASRPSSDPTPINPIGLKLALTSPEAQVAYLARPCQYTMQGENSVCEQKYWTTHRFAPEVVAATSRAIDFLKEDTGAKQIRLIGYSGGGAVAVLVAAGREDVCILITIAGNLDHALWTKYHFVDSLSGSLNPVDVAKKLSHLPQLHFFGSDDEIMPWVIAESYLHRLGQGHCIELVEVVGTSHSVGWLDVWPTLRKKALLCHKCTDFTSTP